MDGASARTGSMNETLSVFIKMGEKRRKKNKSRYGRFIPTFSTGDLHAPKNLRSFFFYYLAQCSFYIRPSGIPIKGAADGVKGPLFQTHRLHHERRKDGCLSAVIVVKEKEEEEEKIKREKLL